MSFCNQIAHMWWCFLAVSVSYGLILIYAVFHEKHFKGTKLKTWPKHLRSQRKPRERSSSSCVRRFLWIGMLGLKKSTRVVRRTKLPV
ncbi:hypothetical protein HanRHA438_Chr15g0722101 [Helianthus annuus]|nr:hypothetical protein HanRHA438_Chr15g0722101 [Helianthus annuus]